MSNYYDSQVIQGLLMVEPKSIADTQHLLNQRIVMFLDCVSKLISA